MLVASLQDDNGGWTARLWLRRFCFGGRNNAECAEDAEVAEKRNPRAGRGEIVAVEQGSIPSSCGENVVLPRSLCYVARRAYNARKRETGHSGRDDRARKKQTQDGGVTRRYGGVDCADMGRSGAAPLHGEEEGKPKSTARNRCATLAGLKPGAYRGRICHAGITVTWPREPFTWRVSPFFRADMQLRTDITAGICISRAVTAP